MGARISGGIEMRLELDVSALLEVMHIDSFA